MTEIAADENIGEVIARIECELLNGKAQDPANLMKGPSKSANEISLYKVPFAVYANQYIKQRMPSYRKTSEDYISLVRNSKEDFSQRVQLKPLTILPANSMGSVLGFTYIGENFMARRADLTGKTARMVDIHESIHTPDEYETRILTSWILGKERLRYMK